MSKELLAGLKIAMEGGSDLESAKRSFINAGYNPAEVEEAARILSSNGGASSIIEPTRQERSINENNLPHLPSGKKERKKKSLLLVFIVVAVLVLLGAIGYLIYALLV
jgi:hypothetical protein